MFDGKVEIRKLSDNMVFISWVEEEIALKLGGTHSHENNCAYLSQQNEGTFPSSLIWNAIFGHVNYDNIHLLIRMMFLTCQLFLGN